MSGFKLYCNLQEKSDSKDNPNDRMICFVASYLIKCYLKSICNQSDVSNNIKLTDYEGRCSLYPNEIDLVSSRYVNPVINLYVCKYL